MASQALGTILIISLGRFSGRLVGVGAGCLGHGRSNPSAQSHSNQSRPLSPSSSFSSLPREGTF